MENLFKTRVIQFKTMYKNNFTFKMQKAFTLAEVLIAIAIIGIIAALTLPPVVKNYQKHAAAVRLKKTYDILAQAMLAAEAEHGAMANWDMGCSATASPYEDDPSATIHICEDPTVFIQRYLVPYLKVGRYCDTINAAKGCPAFKYKTLNGKGPYSFGPSKEYPMIYLVDGTRIAVMIFNLWYTEASTGALIVSYKRAQLWLDTTGVAGPNTGGKDVFNIYLMMDYMGQSGLKLGDGYPADLDRQYTCNKKNTYGAGVWCAELIAKDGWQIKYDW